MGAVADGALKERGTVIGVIPQFLMDRELAHTTLSKLIVVDSMHERKKIIYDHSTAFLGLPGGLGTLDELCEVLTWAQLGQHKKKCALFNAKNFYDPFLAQLDHMDKLGFLRSIKNEWPLSFNDFSQIESLWF
jgi:uncharacterized protein (TIGR00730 family)